MIEIRWYRSWPMRDVADHDCHYETGESVPCSICHPKAKYGNRPDPEVPARIVDNLPRILIDQYDYMTAARLPMDKPGFCLLEWDVALESSERQRFAYLAARTPDRVLVAPYNLYPATGIPECAHRYRMGRPVHDGSDTCDTFGLGCVYLPHSVIVGFLESPSAAIGMTDASLSRYVYGTDGPTRIEWTIRPHHLSGD